MNGKGGRRGLSGLEFTPVGILGFALLIKVGRGDGEGPQDLALLASTFHTAEITFVSRIGG